LKLCWNQKICIMLFNNQKNGVWCAITATWIAGPIFLNRLLIQSGTYVTDTLWSIFWEHHGRRQQICHFMQDGASEYTANDSINILNQVFEGRLMSSRLRPERSPDWNPCDLYLWGNLENKSLFKYSQHNG
jgi:hypothetical protein